MTRQFWGTSTSITVDFLLCEDDTAALQRRTADSYKTRLHLIGMFKLQEIGQLILGKIIKIVATTMTTCHILRLKCTP